MTFDSRDVLLMLVSEARLWNYFTIGSSVSTQASSASH